MLQTLKNAWKIAELRSKLLFTAMIVVLYRLGSVIYVPFVNSSLLNSIFDTEGSLFAYFNMLSGDAFSKATLFALSISPYITASIVIQLLTIAIPALERLSKPGPEGRRKLTQITRYCTVALALITSIGYYFFLKSYQIITVDGFFPAAVIVACYCAGASIIMWLAEKINDHGIGNGISIILFATVVLGSARAARVFWMPSFSVRAPTGQTLTHWPQLMQAVAFSFTSFLVSTYLSPVASSYFIS